MRTHVAQVIHLLSGESLRKQKKNVHEAILQAITFAEYPTFAGSTQALLLNYDADKYRYDEYWIPVFEAYIIGNSIDGALIVESFIEQLPSNNYKNIARACPPFIIALLKAANWLEENDNGASVTFQSRIPTFLGQLLRLYYEYAESWVGEGNPNLEGWALGRFSTAMSVYFQTDHPRFLNRMEAFCTAAKKTVDTLNGGGPFLRIVSRELNELMPAQMSLKSSAQAWLAAIELEKENQHARLNAQC